MKTRTLEFELLKENALTLRVNAMLKVPEEPEQDYNCSISWMQTGDRLSGLSIHVIVWMNGNLKECIHYLSPDENTINSQISHVLELWSQLGYTDIKDNITKNNKAWADFWAYFKHLEPQNQSKRFL